MITLFVSCSKEPGHGLNEGDVIRFTVQSADMETRTMYGERTSTKQPILWTEGDRIHIVMYNPDNFSGDHQYAVYRVTDGGNKTAEIVPEGNPLTWKSTQTKVVAYYLPNIVCAFDPDYGQKGFLLCRFYSTQEGTVPDDGWPYDYSQHSSPIQNMNHCPMFVNPTSISSDVVELSFQPLFTAFEITLKNTYEYARYVYGVRIWQGDYNSIVGNYVVEDLTQPLSGSIKTYPSGDYGWLQFQPAYYAGIDYSDEGSPSGGYLARVNGWGEVNNGEDSEEYYGTFTFTIFCCPLSLTDMYVQVCGGEGYSPGTQPTFTYAYPLTNSGSFISFEAQKKHALEITLPTNY